MELLLEFQGMAKSTFYYYVSRLNNPDSYATLREKISQVYAKNKCRYGYRRITVELHNEGILINHKTVQKLMTEMNIKGHCKKVSKYKSYKGNVGKIVPNVLNRDFKANAPNQKWATDITEVKIKEQKLYLSPILDMYNGEIVTYTISNHPNLRLVTSMLHQALKKVKTSSGLIFHSDQGWHYQHPLYQKMLKDKHITQSMSRKGNCLDNSMMENFFGLMKNELLFLQEWKDINQFEQELKKYIYYYNNDRIKLRLKKSPAGTVHDFV